ncbi:MAG: DUF1579 family protein [bacterium]|nr:DUF1579 family protein [bacterium]
MSIPIKFQQLVGDWKGRNRLHLGDWGSTPLHESAGTATVQERNRGQFLEIAYSWEYDGKPQEGVFILGGDNKTHAVKAFWTDSWHLAHQVMLCEGKESADGSISVTGSYKVDGHPDWGWRTAITPAGAGFEYKMFNVSPEGEETIAVEMQMERT